MAGAAKCAHPACQCMVEPKGPYGKYCSDHCRQAGDKTELRCDCQHAPSPRTDILPIALKYVKLSGCIASRRHAPSPCTDILPITLKYVQLSGYSRVIWKCVEISKRIYT